MDDQIIDAAMARGLHADAMRAHPLAGWVVMHDPPEYPDKFVARLVTEGPSAYLLVADTLAGVQEQLPHGLVRSDRRPVDPPEVVEIWFAALRLWVERSLAPQLPPRAGSILAGLPRTVQDLKDR